jgi:hypothetical protein
MSRGIIVASAVGLALFTAGCVGQSRVAAPYAPPAPTGGGQASAKLISDDGRGGLTLPDGTQVQVDQRGGFSLPNGEYVRRDGAGALNLPNGARCLPTRGGFACP